MHLSGCQPEEIDDWIPTASVTQCSFCNLPLDKLAVSKNKEIMFSVSVF